MKTMMKSAKGENNNMKTIFTGAMGGSCCFMTTSSLCQKLVCQSFIMISNNIQDDIAVNTRIEATHLTTALSFAGMFSLKVEILRYFHVFMVQYKGSKVQIVP